MLDLQRRNDLAPVGTDGNMHIPKGKSEKEKEPETMGNTHYTFITKDGRKYSAAADNRIEAQEDIELSCGISLKGARYEEVYKLWVVRNGIVK